MTQARFTIHVPVRHKEGHQMPLILGSVRKALTAAGLQGRVVIRSAEADLGDAKPQEVDLVIVDGEDDQITDTAVKSVAMGLKGLSNHDAVYVTKEPLEAWLV